MLLIDGETSMHDANVVVGQAPRVEQQQGVPFQQEFLVHILGTSRTSRLHTAAHDVYQLHRAGLSTNRVPCVVSPKMPTQRERMRQ